MDKTILPPILLPADDIVPLEKLDGLIPIGIGIAVIVVWEEHAYIATIFLIVAEIIHIRHQL
jgi:hypothetical protein